MRNCKFFAIFTASLLLLSACGNQPQIPETNPTETNATQEHVPVTNATKIELTDEAIQIDGAAAGSDPANAVYIANDIIYYESGKDFTYGEGTKEDAHQPEAAAAHTVVHITQPGTYSLTGKLSKGQIAVDLGEDAKEDPNAVVTLILNGVDITCEVAPAVIFYNVYECGSDDAEKASKDVDTSAAGANVIIADGSENIVNGAYVAKIYKPDSVVLNEDGTQVQDAKKLHKYDGAFYSKMSMNISGGKENTGSLQINAANEGLDSELHLTVNGGNITILSGNDGINTNEDNVSVTTVNGGNLTICVTGETGEGDGIDSNGWLVINGGKVVAQACSNSADAGIDSDMGIHINGGTVIASGHMLDRIEDGGQTYAVFTFAQKQSGAETIRLKDAENTALFDICPENAYSILIYSSPDLKAGTYTLWSDDAQLAGQTGGMGAGPGMGPGGMMPSDGQGNMEIPEGTRPQNGMEPPEGQFPQDRFPEGGQPPERPDGNGQQPDKGQMSGWIDGGGSTTEFRIAEGGNMFSNIIPVDQSA